MKQNYVAVRDMFQSKDTLDILNKVLPGMVSVDRLLRVSLTVIRTNDKLMTCSPQSLLSCLIGCGQLGLSPDPYLGQAYFVPFWSSKLNCLEATLIPGYKGLITLARRSGHVADVDAMVVHWNDEFKAVKGLYPELHHIENEKDPGEFRGAWAMFRYQTTGWQPTWQYLSKTRIDRHMNMTKSKDRDGKVFGPWVDHYDAMALKTAIRVTAKFVPMAVEEKFSTAIKAEDMALAGEGQSNLFLPAGHADIRTRDYDAEIEELVMGWSGREHVAEFIGVAAAESGKDPFELKKMLLDGDDNLVANFKEGFEAYMAGKKKLPDKEKKPVTDPVDPTSEAWEAWRKEWINLRKPESFVQYFESHLDQVYNAPFELQARFAKKFEDMMAPVKFPMNKHDAEGLILNNYEPEKTVAVENTVSTENIEGDDKGDGEKTSQNRSDMPEDRDLDNLIQFFKNTHPRVWIQVMKGKKPVNYVEKIDAIVNVGGMIDLPPDSWEGRLLGDCVRCSMK